VNPLKTVKLFGISVRTIATSMVSVGVTLLCLGFIVDSLVTSEVRWGTHTYSDSYVLEPFAHTEIELNITKSLNILSVVATSHNLLEVTIIANDFVYYEWTGKEITENAFLDLPGIWTVKFQNPSPTMLPYSYTVTLKEKNYETRKPFIWLFTPSLICGSISVALGSLCLLSSEIPKGILDPSLFYSKLREKLAIRWRWRALIKTTAIVSMALLMIFSYQVMAFFLKTDSPWIVPVSWSMSPTIEAGDLVFLQGTDPRKLEVGEIILFKKIAPNLGSGALTLSIPTLHRIARIENSDNHLFFVTKGDLNQDVDDWFVPEDGISGKVFFVIPRVGIVFIILARIEVKLFIISIIIFLLIIWPSKKKTEKEKPELVQGT